MAENFPFARRRFVVIESADHGANISIWLAPWGSWFKVGETERVPRHGQEALRIAMDIPTRGDGNILCLNSQLIGGRA